ncbi:uncharacterized protein LOC135503151 [Lineus longissimus]|uniref:uncharacterized protein LOC135503151 n=1 Tax=Lineus longissimus TaxID=88925 RepID=UPI00315DC096
MRISMQMYRSGEQQELERQINIYKSVRRRRPINMPPIVGFKKLPALYNHTSLVGRRVQAGNLTERPPDDKPQTLLIDTPKDSFVIARQALWSYQTKNRGTKHVRPLSGDLPPIPYRFKPEESTSKSMKDFLTTSPEAKDSETRKQRPCWNMSKRRKDTVCLGSDGNGAFSDCGESIGTQYDNVHTVAVRRGECSAGNRKKGMDRVETPNTAFEAEDQFDANPYDEDLKTKTKQDIYDTYIVGVPREGVSPIMYDDVIHGSFLLGRNQNVIDKSAYGDFARTTLPRRVPSLDISKMHAPLSTPPKNGRFAKKSSFFTIPPLTDSKLNSVGKPAKPNSNCYPVFSQHPHDAPVGKLGSVKPRTKLSKLKISLSQNKKGRRNSKGGDSHCGDERTEDMSRPLSPDPGSEHSVELNLLQIQSENNESDTEFPNTDVVRDGSDLPHTEPEPSNTGLLRSDNKTYSVESTRNLLSEGESRLDTSRESSNDVIMVTISKK